MKAVPRGTVLFSALRNTSSGHARALGALSNAPMTSKMKETRPARDPAALLIVPRSVLAYNLTRVMNIMGIKPLMAAIRA